MPTQSSGLANYLAHVTMASCKMHLAEVVHAAGDLDIICRSCIPKSADCSEVVIIPCPYRTLARPGTKQAKLMQVSC